MTLFENSEFIYISDENDGETCEYSYMKNRFISQCNPASQNEYNYYLKFAKIYCNINLLRCKYSDVIENSLNTLIFTKQICL
jgi:hypothetical protein